MYIIAQEVTFEGKVLTVGTKVEKPTRRMIELNIVKEVKDEVKEKPAKESKPVKKKVKKSKEPEKVAELLTEQSGEVDVTITDGETKED